MLSSLQLATFKTEKHFGQSHHGNGKPSFHFHFGANSSAFDGVHSSFPFNFQFEISNFHLKAGKTDASHRSIDSFPTSLAGNLPFHGVTTFLTHKFIRNDHSILMLAVHSSTKNVFLPFERILVLLS